MTLLYSCSVLPSADLARDLDWYRDKLGFSVVHADGGYAVLRRGPIYLHLQWHADTPEDPLLGGSVVKFFVDGVAELFREVRGRGCGVSGGLRRNTPWGTHEFGVYDPNRNAIFFVEDATADPTPN